MLIQTVEHKQITGTAFSKNSISNLYNHCERIVVDNLCISWLQNYTFIVG